MSLIHEEDKNGDTMELVDIDGYRLCTFFQKPEVIAERFRNIRNFACREDDIFICGPGKSGTHWLWEIICMLCAGKDETIPGSKVQNMIEATTWEKIEQEPSPRVLNSHVHYRLLPREMKEKKCKIVFVLRNPKDVVVSHYNHVVGLMSYKYHGKWQNFLQWFFDGKLEYGDWFSYVLEWEDLIMNNPDLPIHMVYYEDLKENNLEEINRLGKFLGIENKDNLFERVSEKCQFKNMRKDKEYPPELRQKMLRDDFTIYRKGDIGDWKNWFTVAQNEQFDKIYAERMKNSKLKFQYEYSKEK